MTRSGDPPSQTRTDALDGSNGLRRRNIRDSVHLDRGSTVAVALALVLTATAGLAGLESRPTHTQGSICSELTCLVVAGSTETFNGTTRPSSRGDRIYFGYRRTGSKRWHSLGRADSDKPFSAASGPAFDRVDSHHRWNKRFRVSSSVAEGSRWEIRARFPRQHGLRSSGVKSQVLIGDEDPPNILILMTDDQPANLDTYEMLPETMRLIRDRGIWFKNAVATTPLCCPARVSLFTGTYTHNHGIRQNNASNFTDHSSTLHAELGRHGYRTAISGKFLNGWSEVPPHFDLWATTGKVGYTDTTFNINGQLITTSEYSTTFIRERAIEFLQDFERSDEAPWLLYIFPVAPHLPATPEAIYAKTEIPGWLDNPATTETDVGDKPDYVLQLERDRAAVEAARAKQLRSLASVDDLVVAIYEELSRLGEENTLVWFLSDNGFMWYEHRLIDKRFPYNESVRIPMFLSWPGRLPQGTVRDNIVANIDVAPTIYSLVGIKPSGPVDGRSVLTSSREFILTEYWKAPNIAIPTWKSLWTPNSSYIEYPEIDEAEYYGPDDPWQLEDAASMDPRASELQIELHRMEECSGASCP
jgi:hypothetical protein